MNPTVSHPAVAWCKQCHIGKQVADVSTDGKLIVFAGCEHEAPNPDRPLVCCCDSSPIGWSSECPVPAHYIPAKGRR
jgi:hypothetical protein